MTELARSPAHRATRDFAGVRRAPPALESRLKPRVTVSFTRVEPELELGARPAELELTVGSATSAQARWVCLAPFAQNWLEIIASKPCREIVLTAQLHGEPSLQHWVLELAERLTQQLSASQPLIRVRFSRVARDEH